MAAENDRWDDTISRMRALLTDLWRRSEANAPAVAELLECLGALTEVHQAAERQPVGQAERRPDITSVGRAPVAEAELRHIRDSKRNIYRVERTGRGLFLAEYRGPDQQPFRVPEDAYNAAAEAMAKIRKPAAFEEILRRFREKASEDLADYLLRTCLRLWTSHESRLVHHTRRQYAPARGTTFARDARRLWAHLLTENE